MYGTGLVVVVVVIVAVYLTLTDPLRRTHHRLLLRVIGYRRERGTYRQLSYA